MARELGQQWAYMALLQIVVSLGCIVVSWWALQQFRFDLFVKQPRSTAAKALQVLFSIALGYTVSRFLLDYLQWSTALRGMF